MRRPEIHADLDDVAAEFVGPFTEFLRTEHGEKFHAISPRDFHRYRLSKIRDDVAESEEADLIMEFYESPYFLGRSPLPYSQPVIRELNQRYAIFLNTFTDKRAMDAVLEWVRRSYKGTVAGVHFVDEKAGGRKSGVYADPEKDRDVIAHMDDLPRNIEDCQENGNGTVPILFGNYAWNAVYRENGNRENGTLHAPAWIYVPELIEYIEQGRAKKV